MMARRSCRPRSAQHDFCYDDTLYDRSGWQITSGSPGHYSGHRHQYGEVHAQFVSDTIER